MKKNLLRIALVSFLFAGLSLLSADNHVQAQTGASDQTFVQPTGSFVSAPEAMIRIDQAIIPLKNTIGNYAEGTPEYIEAFSKYSYYNLVYNFILEGRPIPEAIVEGLKVVSTDAFGVSSKKLPAYKLALVALLRP